jgi:hypothetical protein
VCCARRQKARPDPMAQNGKVLPAIFIVAVDGLTPVATRCDVVNGAGELQAEGAGHERSVLCAEAKGKT